MKYFSLFLEIKLKNIPQASFLAQNGEYVQIPKYPLIFWEIPLKGKETKGILVISNTKIKLLKCIIFLVSERS